MSHFLQTLCKTCEACQNLITLEPGPDQCDICQKEEQKQQQLEKEEEEKQIRQRNEEALKKLNELQKIQAEEERKRLEKQKKYEENQRKLEQQQQIQKPETRTATKRSMEPDTNAPKSKVCRNSVVKKPESKPVAMDVEDDDTVDKKQGLKQKKTEALSLPNQPTDKLPMTSATVSLTSSASTAATPSTIEQEPKAATVATSSSSTPSIQTSQKQSQQQLPKGPPSEWSIEDVIHFIASTDPALAVHAELFRKHVSIVFGIY